MILDKSEHDSLVSGCQKFTTDDNVNTTNDSQSIFEHIAQVAQKFTPLMTSNVTGRHRGPKCKLQTGVACAAHF